MVLTPCAADSLTGCTPRKPHGPLSSSQMLLKPGTIPSRRPSRPHICSLIRKTVEADPFPGSRKRNDDERARRDMTDEESGSDVRECLAGAIIGNGWDVGAKTG